MSGREFHENALKFGEGEEECGVERGGETTPLSSSNKRIKEMPIDRFSELPDSLLVHILSFLGVVEAGRTSVLSKRWKFLWAELPNLEFWEELKTVKKLDIVSLVNRTIAVRKGGYLEKFLVNLIYYNESLASDVDAWVDFSVRNKVKELTLALYPVRPVKKCAYYTPPQKMYSCSSLTCLHLVRCMMAYGSVEWKSLTSLSLYDVKLDQRLIDEILSSCPVLNSLEMKACWGFTRLEINCRCLENLRVRERNDYEEPYMEITAPYISYLKIKVPVGGSKLKVKNISSVVTAYVNFSEYAGDFTNEELMSNAKEFLEHFKHVKKLYVSSRCFEVVSMMAVDGWQLPKFRLQDLTIIAVSEFELIIPGVISMLKSSPNLETLVLDGYETEERNIFDVTSTANYDLDDDLMHLKKIRVKNLADRFGEPLLTLAQILLRRAPILEEMMNVIDVEDMSDFISIIQDLITYPRSSPKARVYMISP